jgi:hypothetical protein
MTKLFTFRFISANDPSVSHNWGVNGRMTVSAVTVNFNLLIVGRKYYSLHTSFSFFDSRSWASLFVEPTLYVNTKHSKLSIVTLREGNVEGVCSVLWHIQSRCWKEARLQMNNGLAVLGQNPKSTSSGQTYFHTSYISGNVLISPLHILSILQTCSHHVNSVYVYDRYRGSVHPTQLVKKLQ